MKTDKLSRFGETLLLWMLCTVCTSAIICIYTHTIVNIWSVVGAMLSALVILFADFARTKKLGGLLYVAVLICVSFVPSLALKDMRDMFTFIRWFFSGSEAVDTQTSFLVTLTIMSCFLFTSAAYYFTKVIYRSSVMTLISLIPFAIAVKTDTSLSFGYTAIAAALNIVLFILNARKNVTEGAETRGNATFVVYTDFTVAVILLALILPKPSVAPYYEKFEEMANRFQFGGTGETQFTGEYKDYSGVTDDLRRGESVLIYIANTKNPVYMKSQVFDIYDSDGGMWVKNEKMSGIKKWQGDASLLSYEKLGDAIENLLDSNPQLSDYYHKAADLSTLKETESYATIYTQNYPSVYVLGPLRATGVNLSAIRTEYSARTEQGEIFTNRSFLPADAGYTVMYYTEDIFDELINEGFCDISAEDYGIFLSEAFLSAEQDSEEWLVLKNFSETHNRAMEYAEATTFEIPQRIKALADEITYGLEYDYQKAEAIKNYFYENGFMYDLGYIPPADSDTPEYFLFESKKGICSDFATAYTLLAEAAGLNVRYAEGFVMQDANTTPDMYYIYTDNAHAYPEVYIPGAGWVVYEPTPGSILAAGEQNDDSTSERRTDPLAVVFTAIIAIVVTGLFILILVLSPKILEGIFRIKVRISDNSKAVALLYKRHSANMENRFGGSCKALTPEQLSTYTEEKTALTLEPLIKPFIKSCYGGIKLEAAEKAEAFECYKEQYMAIRKIKKRKD